MGNARNEVIIPVAPSLAGMSDSYLELINDIKESIKQERLKIVLMANKSMIILYWNIGNKILEKQQAEGWGTKVIDRLSKDLKNAFPEMQGFYSRNLKYMRKFAECCSDIGIVQRIVAQIPWRSNIVLLDKLDDMESRLNTMLLNF
jgi:predicted nuclease of restriction endonuclease-like (RecB) superfamily